MYTFVCVASITFSSNLLWVSLTSAKSLWLSKQNDYTGRVTPPGVYIATSLILLLRLQDETCCMCISLLCRIKLCMPHPYSEIYSDDVIMCLCGFSKIISVGLIICDVSCFPQARQPLLRGHLLLSNGLLHGWHHR